ncbi:MULTISPECIES: aKG-HExxH-type peptide beta-hydroxylase [Streptomyces]|uniref:aKG-HExxH-type peptide beta-hydroxylase n=1 Tax=Streptomyces TaxID=1883 RepID=UPI00099C6E21|nr:HEXXH motif-containing putative peptide modification protein [Streptomyces sp. NRRL S-1868]
MMPPPPSPSSSLPPFAVSRERLRAWGGTRPLQGDAALLRDGLHSLRLLLLKSLLTRAEREAPAAALARVHGDWALLERAEARDAAAVRDALGHPAAGAWLASALAARGAAEFTRRLSGFGSLAARVASAARLPPYAPPGTPEALRLPGSDAVLADADAHLAGCGALAGLAPAGPLGAKEAAGWRELWSGALELLRAVDPERAQEIAALVRCVVPVVPLAPAAAAAPASPGARVSVTCWSAPWAVFTTLPADAEEFAEILVHETQHSKLAVLGELVRLQGADGGRYHRVGWRTDPRPPAAILQGTYAHLALAGLWARTAAHAAPGTPARERARARCDTYCAQVGEALGTLRAYGQLTDEGREFVEGMHGCLTVTAAGAAAPADGTCKVGHFR